MYDTFDTFNEGYDAFYDGALPWQNPYDEGTIEHREWLNGWVIASADAVRGTFVD